MPWAPAVSVYKQREKKSAGDQSDYQESRSRGSTREEWRDETRQDKGGSRATQLGFAGEWCKGERKQQLNRINQARIFLMGKRLPHTTNLTLTLGIQSRE